LVDQSNRWNSWTNRSYWFTTTSQPSGVASSPSSPPPSEEPSNQEETTDENPPDAPQKPSGPVFIERVSRIPIRVQQLIRTVIVYDYALLVMETYSKLDEFIDSNSSISQSHEWQTISTFQVRVIAQDENNTNSSGRLLLMLQYLRRVRK